MERKEFRTRERVSEVDKSIVAACQNPEVGSGSICSTTFGTRTFEGMFILKQLFRIGVNDRANDGTNCLMIRLSEPWFDTMTPITIQTSGATSETK